MVIYAGSEIDELGEIAPVELELGHFLGGDGAGDFRGLRFDLGDVFAGYDHFTGEGADFEADVHAQFLADADDHAVGLVFLEAFGRDGDVVGADGKGGDDPFTVVIGDGVAGDADGGVGDHYVSADNDGARGVPHRAGEGGGVLGEGGGGAEEKREQAASLAKKFHLRLQVAQSTRGFCEPEC